MAGFSDGGTRDKDRGFKAYRKRMEEASGKPHVRVGVTEDVGGQAYADGLTTAQVATFNEFGTDRIPERSFIRSTVIENYAKYVAQTKKLFLAVLAGTPVSQALAILGEVIQADIQNKIASGVQPANKASTIKAKGSDKPLIDTGQLRQSIKYKVYMDGGENGSDKA